MANGKMLLEMYAKDDIAEVDANGINCTDELSTAAIKRLYLHKEEIIGCQRQSIYRRKRLTRTLQAICPGKPKDQ